MQAVRARGLANCWKEIKKPFASLQVSKVARRQVVTISEPRLNQSCSGGLQQRPQLLDFL